jgi:hypothetical protein
MLTNKQQQNIQTNLQRIILENKARIVSEIYHSPQMYGMLMENKTTQRPSEEKILLSLFETLMTDENFMRQNIGILSLDTLTEEQKKIIYSNISEGWLGNLLKKIGGWIWEGGKWVYKQLGKGPSVDAPGRRPGRFGDDFMPTWRKPDGKWQTWDPNAPHWPGPPKGPFGGPGSITPDLGPPPMVPDYSNPIINPYWSLPPEE